MFIFVYRPTQKQRKHFNLFKLQENKFPNAILPNFLCIKLHVMYVRLPIEKMFVGVQNKKNKNQPNLHMRNH